jgi:hypothetical protein
LHPDTTTGWSSTINTLVVNFRLSDIEPLPLRCAIAR